MDENKDVLDTLTEDQKKELTNQRGDDGNEQ